MVGENHSGLLWSVGLSVEHSVFRLRGFTMAETTKLSVQKALEKLRSSETPKSRDARRNDEIDALKEEIERMRAQRLRFERPQGRRD
jgi:hypothetical protein